MINAFLTPMFALAASGGGWENDGGGWWFFGPLMFLFWFGIIAFFFWFWGRRWHRGPRDYEMSSTERAQRILAERYARGEISSEEYRERYDQLQ